MTENTQSETEEKVEKTEQTEQPVKKGWAESVSARASNAPEEPRSFLQRIAPKSKKGRVVFAAGTAQVVSIGIMMLAGYMFREHKPRFLRKLEVGLMNYFGKSDSKMLENFLTPSGWRGFLDLDERAEMDGYVKAQEDYFKEHGELSAGLKRGQHRMQAGKLIELSILGATNIFTTLITRNILDRKLDINLGKKSVFKTQMLDTVAGLGTMFLIPKAMPDVAHKGREGIRGLVNKWPVKEENMAKRDSVARSAGFAVVNVSIPDFVGFAVGLRAMMKDLEAVEKEKQEKQNASLER